MRLRFFVLALLVGLAIRVATLPLPGNDDVVAWKIWSYAASHDVTSMYGVGGTPTIRGVITWGERWGTVNYPPVFLYEYAVVGRLYRWFFPDFPDTLALVAAVKAPILLANIGLTWLLFVTVKHISQRPEAAQWAALAYWLNPASLFGGEMLGYVDVLFMVPAVAGLVLASRRHATAAGALIALAVATKPQALLIGPAFALLVWQWGGTAALVRAGGAFVATSALVIAPFVVRGAFSNMWLAFGSFYQRRDTMSAFAANLGWVANWVLRSWLAVPQLGWRAFLQVVPRPLSISRFQELGYPNPRPWCATAVVGVVAWAMWVSRRARDLPLAAALGAFTVHAFFVLNVGAHENHQLFEIPLLVLAAACRPRFRPVLLAVSAVVALNINFYYGISLGWGWAIPRRSTGLDVSVVLAFVNIGVMLWFARVFSGEASRSIRQEPASEQGDLA